MINNWLQGLIYNRIYKSDRDKSLGEEELSSRTSVQLIPGFANLIRNCATIFKEARPYGQKLEPIHLLN